MEPRIDEVPRAPFDVTRGPTSGSRAGFGVHGHASVILARLHLLDPGWLRTDLGGAGAPNDVASVLPGALVRALVDGEVHGARFRALDYKR